MLAKNRPATGAHKRGDVCHKAFDCASLPGRRGDKSGRFRASCG